MKKLFFNLLIGFGCASSTLIASTILQQSVEEEIRSAEVICAVKVLSTESRLKGDRVETLYRVAREGDCLKGSANDEFYLLTQGGSYSLKTPQGNQRLTTLVPGVPQFEVGQRQVVYLQATDEGNVFRLNSWTHFELVKDSQKFTQSPGRVPTGSERGGRAVVERPAPQDLKELQNLVNQTLN
jgi:hypothetical protein